MPGPEVQAKIMQAGASFHSPISKVIFPDTQLIFDNPIAFNSSDGMFNPDAQAGNLAIAGFFFRCKLLATRLLLRLDDGHIRQSKTLKASILAQAAPGR